MFNGKGFVIKLKEWLTFAAKSYTEYKFTCDTYVYSKPCQTSKMELSTKKLNGF